MNLRCTIRVLKYYISVFFTKLDYSTVLLGRIVHLGDHVTHRLDRRVQVVVGFLPSHVVDLRVELRVHLVLEVDEVLGEVLLLLLSQFNWLPPLL